VIVAQSVGIAPDYVTSCKGMTDIFLVQYKGYNLVLGFFEIPTFEYAREHVEDLYFAGIELEYEEGADPAI
jgi:hypothetical protein